ncbi:MAG: ATP-grasp domain-containing protein [Deltaproteobacteria bacterium]|nr:ATP-grasp domain-containing protein [Deltaproteobacteria bacterium]MBI3295570.1 ATP-grasp domain-containing protein [Deltaproteobacteria bacterium]
MGQGGCVIIVDGYSTGNLLAPEFRKLGMVPLHVQTTPEIWPLLQLTYKKEDYDHHFAFQGDLARLASELAPCTPTAVLPGTETGVELADQLGEALGCPTNGIRFSEARRNKFLMIEAVGHAGLKVARQTRAHDAKELVTWVKAQGLRKIVVKPLKSAGTDSVATCFTEDEIRAACERILGRPNQLGLLNEEVLAQEFLEGTEYALDIVSRDGVDCFSAIWRYHKKAIPGNHFVFDRDELVPCDDETGQILCEYARKVLKALAITIGPSHAEVMLTPDGPALVEIGTRLNGVLNPALCERCVGFGQLDLTIDCYTNPDRFHQKAATPYKLKEHAASVFLLSDRVGVVRSVPGEKRIAGLDSYSSMRLRAKPGYQLKPTIDFYTHPGWVTLIHPQAETLEEDRHTIRMLETTGGMYELE